MIRSRRDAAAARCGPSCWLPRPNSDALAADEADDQSAVAGLASASSSASELRPRSGRCRPAGRRDGVDAEQRAREPECGRARRRSSCPGRQVQAVRLEVGGELRQSAVERRALGLVREPDFVGEHEARQVRHARAAVEDARDPALARGLLVDVGDLGLAQARRRRRGGGTCSPACAAASGLWANTPECIFTPAGIPSIGSSSPTASTMSRAVPSPPANSSSSTPRRASPRPRPGVRGGRRALDSDAGGRDGEARPPSASSAPIAPGAARTSIVPAAVAQRARSARAARAGACATAPSARARRDGLAAVAPFSATAPPIPATGLTIIPSRGRDWRYPRQASGQPSSAATTSAASRATSTISSISASVTTNGGRERDRVGLRQRAGDHAALEAVGVDAGGDPTESGRTAASARAPRRTRRRRSGRAREPRRPADDRRTRSRSFALQVVAALAGLGDEAVALDHVEVGQRAAAASGCEV